MTPSRLTNVFETDAAACRYYRVDEVDVRRSRAADMEPPPPPSDGRRQEHVEDFAPPHPEPQQDVE